MSKEREIRGIVDLVREFIDSDVTTGTLTKNAKSWFISTAKPIAHFVTQHHGNDLNAFNAKWGIFKLSKFKKEGCK